MTERVESLLESLLEAVEEQTAVIQEQTAAVLQLCELQQSLLIAMADEQGSDDGAPATYMDGSPVDGKA